MIAVVISAIVEKFVYKYVHCIFLASLMYVNYHLLDAREVVGCLEFVIFSLSVNLSAGFPNNLWMI